MNDFFKLDQYIALLLKLKHNDEKLYILRRQMHSDYILQKLELVTKSILDYVQELTPESVDTTMDSTGDPLLIDTGLSFYRLYDGLLDSLLAVRNIPNFDAISLNYRTNAVYDAVNINLTKSLDHLLNLL